MSIIDPKLMRSILYEDEPLVNTSDLNLVRSLLYEGAQTLIRCEGTLHTEELVG